MSNSNAFILMNFSDNFHSQWYNNDPVKRRKKVSQVSHRQSEWVHSFGLGDDLWQNEIAWSKNI